MQRAPKYPESIYANRFLKKPSQVAFVFLVGLPVVAHGQNSESAAHREVKKTVDAFLGHWNLTGSYTGPHLGCNQ